MKRVCVIDLPGLSRELLGHVPRESAFGKWVATRRVAALVPSWPAVTCSVQGTITTGKLPSEHGMVGNGVATFRSVDDQELVDASNFAEYRKSVSFWEQSNQFLDVRRFWQKEDGTSRYKTALLFFQQSMPGFGAGFGAGLGVGQASGQESGQMSGAEFAKSPRPSADVVLTPKPDHGPDGKLTSLCWSNPAELVPRLFKELGPFPLMNYWGPMAGIASSQWIAKAAALVRQMEKPTLQMVYVPHLDYDLQRFGPASLQAKKAVEDVSAALEPLLDAVMSDGGEVLVFSEYAVHAVERSIAPNRILRDAGLLVTRSSADGELIDFAKSKAFAMVDHEIAHLYSKESAASDLLRDAGLTIVDRSRLDHRRAGDVLLEAPVGAWLDYRWWSDPADAPAFARTVDIHRKPGYDPLELFLDPKARAIVQDASLIRGSHGRVSENEGVFIGGSGDVATMQAIDVGGVIEGVMGV